MPARLLRVIAVSVALAIVVGTGVAWGKIRSFESGINHISPVALGDGGDDGAIDILLVGMDSRTDAHGNPLSAEELATLRAGDDVATNTDTIILVRIPNNGKSATAISIPRDSYVEAPGVGKTKINGVYGSVHLEKLKELVEEDGMDPAEAEPEATEAGREALIKTVANLTGVTVDHYAEIGLLGFALITDALGGVDVCLKDAVYEPLSGADFPAGWQKLDGPQALSFVRQRHDLPRGDLDRVTRQQAVMAALAHQVISGKTLSSPATLNRLQDAVQRSVVLSDGWDIMDFAEQLQKLAAGNVAFATIPVLQENGWSDDGMQSVVRVDPTQVQDWVAGLLHDQDEGKTEELAYSPSKTTVDVVNDTDINGLAAAVSEVLTGKGFTPGSTGNHEGGPVTGSQVQAAKADDLGAQAVSKELGGLPVVEDASVAPGSVRVVLANDYTGPGSGLDGSDPTLTPPTPRPSDPPTRRPRRRRSSPRAPTTRSASTRRDHSQFRDTRPAHGLRSGRSADHLLRRRHRRTHRAVHRHARQLGRQDRQPVTRRTGRRSGQPCRGAAARALADRRGAVRDLVDRRGSRVGRRDDRHRAVHRRSAAGGRRRRRCRRDRGAVAGPVRQAGARPSHRRDGLRHRGAGARRPDLARTPSGRRAGRPVRRRRTDRRPSISRRTGFHRDRPGAVDGRAGTPPTS